MDGELDGKDLDSLYEYSVRNNTECDELSFCELTDVYFSSEEVRKAVNPFQRWIGRSHLLNMKKGGYFPPHRDDRGDDEQLAYRIIIPLTKCNPPDNYFIHDGRPLQFEHGRAYFVNTNLTHSVFSFDDNCVMMVMNVECCDESMKELVGMFYNL